MCGILLLFLNTYVRLLVLQLTRECDCEPPAAAENQKIAIVWDMRWMVRKQAMLYIRTSVRIKKSAPHAKPWIELKRQGILL